MHLMQKLCPQGIVTGSFSRSRQTGHVKESSSFFKLASAIVFAFSHSHKHTERKTCQVILKFLFTRTWCAEEWLPSCHFASVFQVQMEAGKYLSSQNNVFNPPGLINLNLLFLNHSSRETKQQRCRM